MFFMTDPFQTYHQKMQEAIGPALFLLPRLPLLIVLPKVVHAWQGYAFGLVSQSHTSYRKQMLHVGWYQQTKEICSELEKLCTDSHAIPLNLLFSEYLQTMKVRILQKQAPTGLRGKHLRQWKLREQQKMKGRRQALDALYTCLIFLFGICSSSRASSPPFFLEPTLDLKIPGDSEEIHLPQSGTYEYIQRSMYPDPCIIVVPESGGGAC